MARTRRAGYTLRQTKAGRWQLLVTVPKDKLTGKEGEKRTQQIGMGTFASKTLAEAEGRRFAAEAESGRWVDPRRGEIALRAYLADWQATKQASAQHGDRYASEVARLVRLHIDPVLGHILLVDLSPAAVRRWYDRLKADRVAAHGQAGLVPAKAYRVLHAALQDAVRDELIVRNPCQIVKGGTEDSAERPLVEPEQLLDLADAVPERWRALVLVAGWCGLRFGELAGLQRRHVDLLHRTITVDEVLAQVEKVGAVVKKPKTRAGTRSVAVPDPLVRVLEDHLARFAAPGVDGYMFVGPKGGKMRRQNWAPIWDEARTSVGLKEVTLHDLRHAAGTMAAQTGATAREIQRRLGHASPVAAHRYQHAAERRDRALADKLAEMMPDMDRRVSVDAHRTRKQRRPRPNTGI